jgi:serine/threonine-protein kinase HipA
MTTRRPDTVAAYADPEHFDKPLRMGSLRCQTSRTGDIFSFEYDPAWLRQPDAFTFDPDLALVNGPQYPVTGRADFGIFLDSSPDRWGRVLMQRRENMLARREGRRARALTEWDFLLGESGDTAIPNKTRARVASPGSLGTGWKWREIR